MQIFLKVGHSQKVELFDYPPSIDAENHSHFVVETIYGADIAQKILPSVPNCQACLYGSCNINDDKIPENSFHLSEESYELKNYSNQKYKIIRPLSLPELEKHQKMLDKESENIEKASQLAKKNQLKIKIISAYSFLEEKKVLFTFFSETRIDFRNYLKDLAKEFLARIELLQINSREFASFIGGIGTCGQIACCSKFSSHKQSSFHRNESKTNNAQLLGLCNRLKCCIKYDIVE